MRFMVFFIYWDGINVFEDLCDFFFFWFYSSILVNVYFVKVRFKGWYNFYIDI